MLFGSHKPGKSGLPDKNVRTPQATQGESQKGYSGSQGLIPKPTDGRWSALEVVLVASERRGNVVIGPLSDYAADS